MFSEGVPAAIEKLVQLADAVPDHALLNYLGGGPFGGPGPVLGRGVEEIVAAARRSSNFAAALRTVRPTPNALSVMGTKRHVGTRLGISSPTVAPQASSRQSPLTGDPAT